MKYPLLLVSLVVSVHSEGQAIYHPVADFGNRRMYGYSEFERFNPVGEKQPKALFFFVDPTLYRDSWLAIGGRSVEAVFINGKLFASGTEHRIAMKDLASAGECNARVTILFEPGGERQLDMQLVSAAAPSAGDQRSQGPLRDFVFVGIFLLLVFWTVLSMTQSKLAGDYARFFRGFTLRDPEDRLLRCRMGGSGNIPFYVFTSMFLSFILLIAFQFSPESFPLAEQFKVTGVGQAFLLWALLFTGVVVMVTAKLILVSVLGILFDLWEFSVSQFFSFMQIILGVSSMSLLVMVVYFVLRGANSSVYSGAVILVLAVTAVWIVTLFVRLSGQSGSRPFHLFSYLCATEIIPLLITLGVVYKD